jgi:hypothetical protein
MLNHLFYQNPTTFGNYILILKKIVSSDDFIVIFQKKIVDQIAIKGLPSLRKSIFLKKIDFEISTSTESPNCPLSDYVRFIALWIVFGGENSGLPTYPLTPVYRCHKLVDSFSRNHFFEELGTDFSDFRRGSELPFFLNKRREQRPAGLRDSPVPSRGGTGRDIYFKIFTRDGTGRDEYGKNAGRDGTKLYVELSRDQYYWMVIFLWI